MRMNGAELHHLARRLRGIALLATGNTEADSVTAGEIAVIEDIARHPGATISDVTHRTELAQSLVSRITRAMKDAGVLRIEPDPTDGRKVRLDIEPAARSLILGRAGNDIDDALATVAPGLDEVARAALTHHLSEAARILSAVQANPSRRP